MSKAPNSSIQHQIPERLTLASGNDKKRAELQRILEPLGIPLNTLQDFPALEAPEETGSSFAENARLKARYYARHTSRWCVADDSGIQVDALDGAPGVRSARFAGENANDESNNNMLLQQLETVTDAQRTARYRCAIALARPDGKIVFECEEKTEGRILHRREGSGGFGYDPLFYSTELDAGFATVSAKEKDQVSHRGKALRRLGAWFRTGTTGAGGAS